MSAASQTSDDASIYRQFPDEVGKSDSLLDLEFGWVSCQDSDGGMNQFERGTVNATLRLGRHNKDFVFRDYNIGHNNLIIEFYCREEKPKRKIIACEFGRGNGACIQPVSTADVGISKTADRQSTTLGAVVTYTLDYINLGPKATTEVQISDALDEHLGNIQFVSVPSGVNCALSGTGFECADANIFGVGEVRQVVYTAQALVAGSGMNTVEIVSNLEDPDAANNTDEVIVEIANPPSADVSILKTADHTDATLGDVVTYTLEYTNLGASSTTGVRIVDAFDEHLGNIIFVATPSSVSCVMGVGSFECTDAIIFSVGEVRQIVYTAEAIVAGSGINVVEVSSDLEDPNGANNTDDFMVVIQNPPSADVAVTKTADLQNVLVNGVVTYTVSYVNLGPDFATVQLTDTLDAHFGNVQFVTVPAGVNCVLSGTGFECADANEFGGNEVREIVYTAEALVVGVGMNSIVISSDVFDPDLGNNAQDISVQVTEPEPTSITFAMSNDPVEFIPGTTDAVFGTFSVINNSREPIHIAEEHTMLKVNYGSCTITDAFDTFANVALVDVQSGETVLGPVYLSYINGAPIAVFPQGFDMQVGATSNFNITGVVTSLANVGCQFTFELLMPEMEIHGLTSGTISTGGPAGTGPHQILPVENPVGGTITIIPETFSLTQISTADHSYTAGTNEALVWNGVLTSNVSEDLSLGALTFENVETGNAGKLSLCHLFRRDGNESAFFDLGGVSLDANNHFVSSAEGSQIRAKAHVELRVLCDVSADVSETNTVQLNLNAAESAFENAAGEVRHLKNDPTTRGWKNYLHE
ncbi:DUF11 domain-containing protein [Candidatus Peregrinibacteria bacterium]|nr:DUF11 domain-containing protein [Candidatus Peregrinibacteria bacterium]